MYDLMTLSKIPNVSEAVFLICEMGTIMCVSRGYHVTPGKMPCCQYVLVTFFFPVKMCLSGIFCLHSPSLLDGNE